jgi:hypothetical protein
MTRDTVNGILRQMEQIRMDSYEAETVREERRLDREYGRLWKIIEPYVTGKTPYSEAAAR